MKNRLLLLLLFFLCISQANVNRESNKVFINTPRLKSRMHSHTRSIVVQREKAESFIKSVSALYVIGFAMTGAVILNRLGDNAPFLNGESYKRAAMVMHGVGCGNVCTTGITPIGKLLVFSWLIFATGTESYQRSIGLQSVEYESKQSPITKNPMYEVLLDVTLGGALLAAVKEKNMKLTLDLIFDGMFEVYSKFSRIGFNNMGEKPNGAENLLIAYGLHFHSFKTYYHNQTNTSSLAEMMKFVFLPQGSGPGHNHHDMDIQIHSAQFSRLLTAYIGSISFVSMIQANTFKSREGSFLGSFQQLWHISNTMGMMHIPENLTEKAFLMLFIYHTNGLANLVYQEFEHIMLALTQESAIVPPLVFIGVYASFVLLVRAGKVDLKVLISSLISTWDLGTSTGNGDYMPNYRAGKLALMPLHQFARYAVTTWHKKMGLYWDSVTAWLMQMHFNNEILPFNNFQGMLSMDSPIKSNTVQSEPSSTKSILNDNDDLIHPENFASNSIHQPEPEFSNSIEGDEPNQIASGSQVDHSLTESLRNSLRNEESLTHDSQQIVNRDFDSGAGNKGSENLVSGDTSVSAHSMSASVNNSASSSDVSHSLTESGIPTDRVSVNPNGLSGTTISNSEPSSVKYDTTSNSVPSSVKWNKNEESMPSQSMPNPSMSIESSSQVNKAATFPGEPGWESSEKDSNKQPNRFKNKNNKNNKQHF